MAIGRAPIVKMSRRMPPTPVAAPWNGSMNDGWLWLSILKTTAQPSPMSTRRRSRPGPAARAGPPWGSRAGRPASACRRSARTRAREKRPELGVGRLAAEPLDDPVVLLGREPEAAGQVERDLRLGPRPPPRRGPVLPLEEGAVLDQAAEEGLEDQQPVGAAHRRLGGPLRVRHQPEHRALSLTMPGDVVERAVGVGGRVTWPSAVA